MPLAEEPQNSNSAVPRMILDSFFSSPPTVNALIESGAVSLALYRDEWGRCGVFFPLGWVAEDARRPQRGRVLPPNQVGE